MARSTYVTYAFEWGYLNDKIPFIGETKIAEMGKWIEDYLYALCLRLTESYAQWRGFEYSERLQAHWASGLRLLHVCFWTYVVYCRAGSKYEVPGWRNNSAIFIQIFPYNSSAFITASVIGCIS